MKVTFCPNLYIFWLEVLEPIVELCNFRKYKNVERKFNIFIDVDGPSYVWKMVEIHHQKKSGTSLIIILKFQTNG